MFYLALLFVTVLPIMYFEEVYKGSNETKTKRINQSLLISMGMLLFVGMFRQALLGNDAPNYYKYFMKNYYHDIEIGYVFLSQSIRSLNLDFRWVIISVQLLSCIPIFYYIYTQSTRKWMSIFVYQTLYLYVNSFNIFRQTISMSIVLIAFFVIKNKIEENKLHTYIKAILLVLFASLFHQSALFFLILVPIDYIKLNKVTLLSSIGLSIVLFLYHDLIINQIMLFFNRDYLVDAKIEIGYSTILLLALVFGSLIVASLVNKSYIESNIFSIKVLTFFLIFNILWIWFPNHARLSQYLFLLLVFIIPEIISSVGETRVYYLLTVGFISYLLFLYSFSLLVRDYAGINPYEFCRTTCIVTKVEEV